jgi:hypothetical protein
VAGGCALSIRVSITLPCLRRATAADLAARFLWPALEGVEESGLLAHLWMFVGGVPCCVKSLSEEAQDGRVISGGARKGVARSLFSPVARVCVTDVRTPSSPSNIQLAS